VSTGQERGRPESGQDGIVRSKEPGRIPNSRTRPAGSTANCCAGHKDISGILNVSIRQCRGDRRRMVNEAEVTL